MSKEKDIKYKFTADVADLKKGIKDVLTTVKNYDKTLTASGKTMAKETKASNKSAMREISTFAKDIRKESASTYKEANNTIKTALSNMSTSQESTFNIMIERQRTLADMTDKTIGHIIVDYNKMGDEWEKLNKKHANLENQYSKHLNGMLEDMRKFSTQQRSAQNKIDKSIESSVKTASGIVKLEMNEMAKAGKTSLKTLSTDSQLHMDKISKSTSKSMKSVRMAVDHAGEVITRVAKGSIGEFSDAVKYGLTIAQIEGNKQTSKLAKQSSNHMRILAKSAKSSTDQIKNEIVTSLRFARQQGVKEGRQLNLKFSHSLSSMAKSTFRNINLIRSTFFSLRTAFAVLMSSLGIREIVRITDEMALLGARVRITARDTKELYNIDKKMLGIANRTRTDLKAATQLYSRLSRAAKHSKWKQKELLEVTETVAKTMIISGANQAEMQGALIQFSQALAGNFKRGSQELNSIIEQTPYLATVIAESMGRSTDELKQMGEAGLLSLDNVIEGILKSGVKVNTLFKTIPPIFSQWKQVAENVFNYMIAQIDKYLQLNIRLALWMKALSKNMLEFINCGGIKRNADRIVRAFEYIKKKYRDLKNIMKKHTYEMYSVIAAFVIPSLLFVATAVISAVAPVIQLAATFLVVGRAVKELEDKWNKASDNMKAATFALGGVIIAVFGTIYGAAISAAIAQMGLYISSIWGTVTAMAALTLLGLPEILAIGAAIFLLHSYWEDVIKAVERTGVGIDLMLLGVIKSFESIFDYLSKNSISDIILNSIEKVLTVLSQNFNKNSWTRIFQLDKLASGVRDAISNTRVEINKQKASGDTLLGFVFGLEEGITTSMAGSIKDMFSNIRTGLPTVEELNKKLDKIDKRKSKGSGKSDILGSIVNPLKELVGLAGDSRLVEFLGTIANFVFPSIGKRPDMKEYTKLLKAWLKRFGKDGKKGAGASENPIIEEMKKSTPSVDMWKSVLGFNNLAVLMSEEQVKLKAQFEGFRTLIDTQNMLMMEAAKTQDQMAGETLGQMFSSISDTLVDIIGNGNSATEAIRNLLQSMISMIVKFMIQKKLAHVMSMAMETTATAASVLQAKIVEAAWRGAAAMVSLATQGANAVGAATGMITMQSAMTKMLSQLPGFAEGGVVPPGYSNDSYIARVSSGETILPRKKLDSLLNSIGGSGGGGVTIQQTIEMPPGVYGDDQIRNLIEIAAYQGAERAKSDISKDYITKGPMQQLQRQYR